jgi:hypothetical protein
VALKTGKDAPTVETAGIHTGTLNGGLQLGGQYPKATESVPASQAQSSSML